MRFFSGTIEDNHETLIIGRKLDQKYYPTDLMRV
jgi:hypothetical protein